MNDSDKSDLERCPLKSCPFCGSDRVYTGNAYNAKCEPIGRIAECEDCAAYGDAYATDFLAVKAWNTRSPSPHEQALVSALKLIVVLVEALETCQFEDGFDSAPYFNAEKVQAAIIAYREFKEK